MTTLNESEVTAQLSDMILKAGANLFKATKYLYALTADTYYHCDIKDFFKVILNNIFNVDILSSFQISIDEETCPPLSSREYFNVFKLIIFSIAVRLPLLCNVRKDGCTLTPKQVDAIYSAVIERGIENISDAVSDSYAEIAASVRKGREVAPYSAEWFKTYVYTSVQELAEISNRNLYFLGAIDVLLPLYYLCLEKEFEVCLTDLLSVNNPKVS
jgi:hypothetical protein